MGFEIHPAEKPYYQATFTVWEWSRFLDLLLYSAGAINMEQMLNNIIHVSMMEAKALNHGKSEDDIANFDVTEYKKNVEVVKKADRSKMEIIDEDMPDGSKKFVGATIMMKEGTPDDAENQWSKWWPYLLLASNTWKTSCLRQGKKSLAFERLDKMDMKSKETTFGQSMIA